MLRYGFNELFLRWRMSGVMALAVSIPFMGYLLINAYRADLVARYSLVNRTALVVQQTGSVGEILGSRLPGEVATTLRAAGASQVVPEIHVIVGTSPTNAVMLRGIDVEKYSQSEEFRLESGRPLQPGDPPRLAMVGAHLAEQRQAFPGDEIMLRGRSFRVVGVFSTGAYADYEAWVSLADAQSLLGWGSDVSIYIIPDGESLQEGDMLPGGVSVVRRGETGAVVIQEWTPFLNLVALLAAALGVSTAIAMANMLWRLAWLRRRELAILQSVGFGKLAQAGYLFIQGLCITLLGVILGVAEALAVGQFNKISSAGVIIQPLFDVRVIAASLVFAACLALAGTSLPAWWLSRLNLVMLMRTE